MYNNILDGIEILHGLCNIGLHTFGVLFVKDASLSHRRIFGQISPNEKLFGMGNEYRSI